MSPELWSSISQLLLIGSPPKLATCLSTTIDPILMLNNTPSMPGSSENRLAKTSHLEFFSLIQGSYRHHLGIDRKLLMSPSDCTLLRMDRSTHCSTVQSFWPHHRIIFLISWQPLTWFTRNLFDLTHQINSSMLHFSPLPYLPPFLSYCYFPQQWPLNLTPKYPLWTTPIGTPGRSRWLVCFTLRTSGLCCRNQDQVSLYKWYCTYYNWTADLGQPCWAGCWTHWYPCRPCSI